MMILCGWNDLPDPLRTEECRPYYEYLRARIWSLRLKRLGDLVVAGIGVVLLCWLFALVAIWIRLDSPGPIFYRQTRVTQYGRQFSIIKFRTMYSPPQKSLGQLTVKNDPRITRVGNVLRKFRIDELPQLFDVLRGTMSLVGPRPEVPEFVAHYAPEHYATLLMKAGVTSRASLEYKDEQKLLGGSETSTRVYIEDILPSKMSIALEDLGNFSLRSEVIVIARTVREVLL